MVHLISSSGGSGSTAVTTTYDTQARLICGDAGITTAASTYENMTCGKAACAAATGDAAKLVCGTGCDDITGAAAYLTCGTAGVSSATGAKAYLTCGIAGSAIYGNWEALTNTGLFTITINGTEYADLNPDFTAAGSMAGVATALQTVLNAACTGTTCAWSTDHLVITAPATGYGSISVLSSPSTGVDISSYEWMNGAHSTPVDEVHNWKGLGTSAKFSLTINGTACANLNPNFGAVASMADVATALQTVLHAAKSGTTCAWSTDHFVITAPKCGVGVITVLSAPGSGVDISGSGWLNGVAGTATDEVKNWKQLGTAGKFSITVNGTACTNLNPDFSSVASMADVATAIEAVLDAAVTGTTCAWSTDHFVITSPATGTGTITFGRAPGTGTDIAGSDFMAAKATDGGVVYAEVKNWASLGTAGKLTVTIDGVACTNVNPDFSAVTSMAEVADAITTVIDAVVTGATCTWSTDRFIITSPTVGSTGSVTVLSAPGSGTDIAGTAWMNGKTGVGVVTHGADNWEGLAATGKFSITIDGVACTDTNPDFTGVTSMDDVATAIQTALRLAHAGTVVEYDTDHFVITSPLVGASSTITVLSAPGSGTDIAASGYMNGKTGTVAQGTGPVPTTGATPFFDASVGATAQTMSASPATLASLQVTNPNATDMYLQIFDATAPTIGVTTPKSSFWVPALGAYDAEIGPDGIEFATAITYAATTTSTGSGAPGTGLILNGSFKYGA